MIVITRTENDLADFPDTIEGQRARADYFESLYKIERLAHAKTRGRFFGRKSEKLTDAQLQLLGILSSTPAPPLSDKAKALMKAARKGVRDRDAKQPKKRGGGRDWERFGGLPVEVDLIHPPLEEREGKVWATQDITDHVEHIPARTIHHITVRTIWMDPKREAKPAIAELPAEFKVFPGSMYGLNFMINVILGKFADHLPLYRQAGIDARSGAFISRQARNRIVNQLAHLLISIALQLKRKVADSRYLHIDETITRLLDPERRGRSRDAYFWGFLAPTEKAFYLEFSTKRSEKTLFDFFPAGWKGDVQTDGHDVYRRAFRDMPFIRHLECNGHMRRYVLDAMEANEAIMTPILRDITELYNIERRAKDMSVEQRGLYRHALSKPLLKRLQKKFWDLEHDLENEKKLEGKALEAVTYANACGADFVTADDAANRRWRRLALYAKVGNGHMNIDQNPIENKFRPTKLGMKNWLFIGRPEAGWRSAVLYTVLGTCKLLNVNPEAYLRWVLPQLAVGTNKSTAEGLLPHDFARLFPEHVMEPQH